MKNYIFYLKKLLEITSILLIITILGSCIPQKKIKYVQKKQETDTIETFLLKQRPKNTIQPFDNLYIRVISPDEQTSRMFNSESDYSVNQNVNYNMISYTVNDSGFINFPFVGDIKVQDLTILQANDTIQKALSKYISNATTIVKFVGKSVTIIGEVARQGKYVIYDDNSNIFTTISMAGGMTDYGDRENVTIIREIAGVAKYYKIDLTDRNILKSEFYYLKPEDIVIVPPLKAKSYGFATFPYTLVLSSITVILSMLTYLSTF